MNSPPSSFTRLSMNQLAERGWIEAHRMLIDPRFADRTVSSVAFEIGFGDISYFNRTFRQLYGATPTDERAEALAEPARPAPPRRPTR
jgi:AraC-like DNA-binding protein